MQNGKELLTKFGNVKNCQRYVTKRWQPEKVCWVEKLLEELSNKNPEQALVKNETCSD